MELACHIRNMRQLGHLDEFPEHLTRFYPPDAFEKSLPWPRELHVTCTRIYVGDEFCAARMPSLSELKRFGAAAAEKGLGLTLLTPVMTDADIEAAASRFGYLNETLPDAEIVVNDWGVMTYLRAHCSSLELSAGRILDKGFKDPRLKQTPAPADDADPAANGLLNWSTYDGRWVRDQLLAMAIGRCEQDLLPYQSSPVVADDGIKASIYFPFGYITSGRICWIASFDQPAGKRFMPPGRCSRPCADLMLELKDSEFVFRIFQSGNTIFYLYPPSQLESLLHVARTGTPRLVYQGFGMEA